MDLKRRNKLNEKKERKKQIKHFEMKYITFSVLNT